MVDQEKHPATSRCIRKTPSAKGSSQTPQLHYCKACEVACKEWNEVPMDGDLEMLGSSYDILGSWCQYLAHVAFVEQDQEQIEKARESGEKLVSLGMPSFGSPSIVSKYC